MTCSSIYYLWEQRRDGEIAASQACLSLCSSQCDRYHFCVDWLKYIRNQFKYCSSQWKYEPPRDKTNKVSVRSAKTQISLGIRPV